MAPSLPAPAVTVCGEGQGRALNRISLLTPRHWPPWTGRAQPGTPAPHRPPEPHIRPLEGQAVPGLQGRGQAKGDGQHQGQRPHPGGSGLTPPAGPLAEVPRGSAGPPSATSYSPWPRVPGHLAQTPALCGQLAREPIISTHGSLSLRAGPQGPTRSVGGGGPPCRWGDGRGPPASPSACSPLRAHLPPPAGSAVSRKSEPQENRAGEEGGGGRPAQSWPLCPDGRLSLQPLACDLLPSLRIQGSASSRPPWGALPGTPQLCHTPHGLSVKNRFHVLGPQTGEAGNGRNVSPPSAEA